MTESELKNKVKAAIKKRFPDLWVYKTADRFSSGIPDFLICAWGRLVAIELKAPHRPTKGDPIQEYVINAIVKAGGKAKVCNTVEAVLETIEEVKQDAIR